MNIHPELVNLGGGGMCVCGGEGLKIKKVNQDLFLTNTKKIYHPGLLFE